jgi:hypothetical protein
LTAYVKWALGGSAEIVSIVGDKITLRSTRPSPPGSRIEGVVAGPTGTKLRVKVHACRRQAEGDFVLEGRPLDLTREARDRLAGA